MIEDDVSALVATGKEKVDQSGSYGYGVIVCEQYQENLLYTSIRKTNIYNINLIASIKTDTHHNSTAATTSSLYLLAPTFPPARPIH
jgi:hypothetical protein